MAQIRIILRHRKLGRFEFRGAPSAGEPRMLSRAGIVHAMWPPVPGNMKDYITTPKLNGYKALHTVVLPIRSEDEKSAREDSTVFPMEIMIRTEAMHILAENGIVADAEIRQQWRASARRTSRAIRAQRRTELRYAATQQLMDIDLKGLDREEALDTAAAAADRGSAGERRHVSASSGLVEEHSRMAERVYRCVECA